LEGRPTSREAFRRAAVARLKPSRYVEFETAESRAPFRFQIDPQLRALLVKMTALEAERAGGFGDAVAVRGELAQHHFALERVDAARQRPTSRAGARVSPSLARRHQHVTDRVGADDAVGEQQQALDDVAQLADVAGPRVARQLVERRTVEPARLPPVL